MISVEAFFTKNGRSDSLHALKVEIRDRRQPPAGARAVLKFPQLRIERQCIDASKRGENKSQNAVFVPLLGNILPEKMRDRAAEEFRQAHTSLRHLSQFARDLQR